MYVEGMSALTARARNGRLLLDVPTDLPDGAEVELMQVDDWDDLDAADRSDLERALLASEEDVLAGRLEPLEDILAELRRDRMA